MKLVLPALVAVVCALTACKTTANRFDLYQPNKPQGVYTQRLRGMTLAGRYNHQSSTYTYPVAETAGLPPGPPPPEPGTVTPPPPPPPMPETPAGAPAPTPLPTTVPMNALPPGTANIVPPSTPSVMAPAAGSEPAAVPPPAAGAASPPPAIPGLTQ